MSTPRPLQAPTLALARPPRQTGFPWLDALRGRAWESFQRLGLPGPRLDEWKYADTHPLTQSELRLPTGEVPPAVSAQVGIDGIDGPRAVFLDGVFHPGLSRLDDLPAGLRVRPLMEALAEDGERLSRHYGLIADLDGADAGLRALDLALAEQGAVIEVAAGTEVAVPLSLVHLVSDEGLAPQWRHLVILGEGARLTLVEHYQGLGTHWHNAVTEIDLGARAELDHLRLYEAGEGGVHTHETWVRVAEAGRYGSYAATAGARLARPYTAVSLEAPEARAGLYGVYGGSGRHQADHSTRTDHRAPRTQSVQLFKGVLGAGARGAYTGRVVVHPGAQKIEAEQRNANLLLSRQAEADARPQLEIYADDVKCAHGATVGELDRDALFYLRARGIDEAAARALLTRAFVEDVLDAFPLPAAARWARERLAPGGNP